MKLLIITQAVDSADTTLGFFVRWIEEFGHKFEKVTVICLKEGEHHLPARIQVHTLGKTGAQAHGVSRLLVRLRYSMRFINLLLHTRHEYDAVFVHMNQEYVILGGMLWRLWGKRIFLWRNHAKGSLLTTLAVMLSHRVYCTSHSAYTARFAKTRVMPVGIEVADDMPHVPQEKSILVLGRLAPVKRIDVILEAIGRISPQYAHGLTVNIYGDALLRDAAYAQALYAQGARIQNGARIQFHPGVPHTETAALYASHQVYINLTPSGSFDKTILEAMAAGTLVVAANDEVFEVTQELTWQSNNTGELARVIERALFMSATSAGAERRYEEVQFVKEHHSLSKLVTEFAAEATAKKPAFINDFSDLGLLVRYGISGVMGILTNLTVLYILTDIFSIWYIFSAFAALAASLVLAFSMQKFWTFKGGGGSTRHQFAWYMCIALLSMSANVALLYILVDLLHVWYLLAEFGINIVLALVSFVANKRFTFKS